MSPYPCRKKLRLPEYDYSTAGIYFLTICAKERQPLFARINGFDGNGRPCHTLTAIGNQINACILKIPECYSEAAIEHYVIMPNHIHLMLSIRELPYGAPGSSRPTQAVPRIISALK